MSEDKRSVQYVHFSAAISQKSINSLVDILKDCAKSRNRDIHLLFNSEGGGIWPGQHAQTMLNSYPEKISICNVGVIHSAATSIFLAADRCSCAPAATFAFHSITRTFAAGASLNAKEAEIAASASHTKTAAMLDWIVARTTIDRPTVEELRAGHGAVIRDVQWARDNGFVDQIEQPKIPSGRPMHIVR